MIDIFQDARKQLAGAFKIIIALCGLLMVMGIYSLDLFKGVNKNAAVYNISYSQSDSNTIITSS